VNPRRPLPAVALWVAGCLAQPFEPHDARPLDAVPQVYSIWWQQMEDCARVTAPLDQIEWYVVPGERLATPEGLRWGWWSPPHAIYIAEPYLEDEWLVEHEMLHDLLQTGAHPAAFETCGVRGNEVAAM
jgi:hypothetical protein